MLPPLWTIVLAAGSGTRLAPVTHGIPKQFWSADGGPSLVEQTIARLGPLASPARTLTVVGRAHLPLIEQRTNVASLGHLVVQPVDRGTAAGVLAALAPIALASPDDLVLVTPSDHGVERTDLFRQAILDTAATVRTGRADIVLFGVTPDVASTDYGWITPARPRRLAEGRQILPVTGFVEKPSPAEAARLLASGALWNSMVLLARAGDLFDLYRRHLPELADVFIHASSLPPDRRARFITEIYPSLPSTYFSREVLTPAERLTVCAWPATLGWSDLGTPARLARWLRHDRRELPAVAGRSDGARVA
jgi:mannose-1-phosphate guanylyltransferase